MQCLDPHADPDLFAALERDLQARLSSSQGDREQMQKMLQASSTSIRISDSQVRLVAAPEEALDDVANEVLKAPARLQPIAPSGRRFVFARMKSAFEDAGVWELMMKRIAVAPYTFADDPLKIDCGYKPDGTLRLFHAITLDTDAAHSKALAFTYPSLSAGIQREHGAKAELTAVVQENFNPDDGGARCAFNLLRRSNILVATTADLPELAERARKELKV